jgi:hypothetical protein
MIDAGDSIDAIFMELERDAAMWNVQGEAKNYPNF